MDPAAALGGRHALETVAAGFMVEGGKIGAVYLEDDALEAGAGGLPGGEGGQSADAAEMADVSLGELAHQETRVLAALGGADFEQTLHDDTSSSSMARGAGRAIGAPVPEYRARARRSSRLSAVAVTPWRKR